MSFTAQELQNIANAALDFHERGRVKAQTLQSKPLLRDLMARKKTFPGGKGAITGRAKFDYSTTVSGYSHDDTVEYVNPANIKQFSYNWYELHGGIKVTFTELKVDGISVVDTTTGEGTSMHNRREMTALANLFEDKLDDMEEGWERGLNLMAWRDGSQDAKEFPGIRSVVLNDPTSAAVVGGIDQSTVTGWRNRASLAISTTTPSDLNITNTLQTEFRQLRRYGNPSHKMYAGSDWLEAHEQELRTKGLLTESGWMSKGKTDMGIADISFKGTPLEYDPTLDDEGLAKYLFVLDMNSIRLRPMEGEDMKRHSPARPENKYVLYRAKTWTGGLVCNQRNTSGVYSIA